MLQELTFTPLSRNRYRVNDGKAKPTIIKKARLKGYKRDYYGRQRPKPPKPKNVQAPKLLEVSTFVGFADCPHCKHMNYVGNGGVTVDCERCGKRFRARMNVNW